MIMYEIAKASKLGFQQLVKNQDPYAILKTLGTVDKIQDNSVWSQPQIVRAVELELGVRSIAEIKISSENVRDIDHIISNLA